MFSVFKWKKSELGFVLLVLTIVFGLSYYQVRLGQMKTRDAQRKADTELVARALIQYYQEHGEYPASDKGRIVACKNLGSETCNWGEGAIVDADGISYLTKLPEDPFADMEINYVYETLDSGRNIRIYAALENPTDSDVKHNLTMRCGNGIQCNWYAGN